MDFLSPTGGNLEKDTGLIWSIFKDFNFTFLVLTTKELINHSELPVTLIAKEVHLKSLNDEYPSAN